MVVFLLLLSLLVVPVSAADVYDVSDDSSPVLFAAAQWSTADSLHLQQIADRLNSSGGSAASLLATISSKIGSNSNSIFYYLSAMDNRMSNMYNAMVGTGHVGGVSMGEGFFGHLRNMTTNYLSPISSNMSATYSQVKAIADKLATGVSSYPDFALKSGWAYLDADGVAKIAPYDLDFTYFLDVAFLGFIARMEAYSLYRTGWRMLASDGRLFDADRDYSIVELVGNGFAGLVSRMQLYFQRPANRPGLLSDGSITGSYGYAWNLADLTADGFVGLAKRLSGDDRATTFSFLPKDVTQTAVSVSVDNLLDAIGIVGTELQNPLQRLAFVFASDQDLSIRDDVSDNVDSTQDNFFKPGSGGSVSSGNISDAAGLSSGFKDSLSSPVSVGDFFTQFNSGSSYSYFSEQSRADLDTVSSPVAISDIDAFVDDVLALDSDGDGYVSLYNPDSLLDFLGKGG